LCLPFLFSAFAVCRASPHGKVYIGLEHNTLWSKKTAGGVEIKTPLLGLSLEDVIKLGDELGVPFHLTYSCDLGDRHHCGTCDSCKRRREAFSNLNMEDPVTYEV
ncbi:MAG: 7-cyano-7-deazaguanine synthase, partial [Candidatus Thorarchaeota archaeon]